MKCSHDAIAGGGSTRDVCDADPVITSILHAQIPPLFLPTSHEAVVPKPQQTVSLFRSPGPASTDIFSLGQDALLLGRGNPSEAPAYCCPIDSFGLLRPRWKWQTYLGNYCRRVLARSKRGDGDLSWKPLMPPSRISCGKCVP